MHLTTPLAGLCLCLLVALPCTSTGAAQPPVTDQQIAAAIDKAVAFLWSQQQDDGSWAGLDQRSGNRAGQVHGHHFETGPTALAAYALLAAGQSPQDPRMRKALIWLARRRTNLTYSLAFRAQTWLHANRRMRNAYRGKLNRIMRQMVLSQREGMYSYLSEGRTDQKGWDASNSQYGLLAVWAAARNEIEVPRKYWQLVQKGWVQAQNRDGGWGYNDKRSSTASMTAGGIASLYVCFDALYAGRFRDCKGKSEYPPIQRGLEWLGKHLPEILAASGKPEIVGHGDHYYMWYGIERVGLAGGHKFFGTVDWYQAGSRWILGHQADDGHFTQGHHGKVIPTAYALAFLLRGRQPVLLNKLEIAGSDWNNRPRALAYLTDHLGSRSESDYNWQIVSLQTEPGQWHDAPILYLSGAEAPKLTDADIDKLRTFVHQGGTIFSVTECNGAGFSKGIREVYSKLLPGLELAEMDRAEPIYTEPDRLPARLKFHQIHNGVRPLVIHTDTDLALAWQGRSHRVQKWAFDAAWNLVLHVVGPKGIRHRGARTWPDMPALPEGAETITVARLQHGGRWDPEPLAWQRAARRLSTQTQKRIVVTDSIDPAKIQSVRPDLAVLTGTGPLELSAGQIAALKAWLDEGGTLLVDAAGGDKTFAASARTVLPKLIGEGRLTMLPASSPVYRREGLAIDRVQYRGPEPIRDHRPRLLTVRTAGRRAAVLFSDQDLTAALLETPCPSARGYTPESAYRIVRNVLLQASGSAEEE